MKQRFIAHKQKAENVYLNGKECIFTIWIKCIIYVIGTNRRT